MKINQSIHFYGTNDLKKTKQFYMDVCHLSLSKDQIKCHIYTQEDRFYVGFCTHLEVTTANRSPIITFLVDDVQAWHKHMALFSEVSEVSVNDYYHIEHFFCKDPNGYTIEFQRFLKEQE